MLKNQLFGVEVEMTGITREKAATIVAEILGTTASRPDSTCYQTRIIADQAARKWKVMRDSSITSIRNDGSDASMDEYKVEFVTPPLGYDDIELLQNIIRKLRESGAKSHSSCGIHIHVDGANHNANSLRRLVNFMTSRQDLIYEALEIGSRESDWCQKLNSNLLKAMKESQELTKEKAEEIWYSNANDGYCGGVSHEHYNSTRYHGVNLQLFLQRDCRIQAFQQHPPCRENQGLHSVLLSRIRMGHHITGKNRIPLHGRIYSREKSYHYEKYPYPSARPVWRRIQDLSVTPYDTLKESRWHGLQGSLIYLLAYRHDGEKG